MIFKLSSHTHTHTTHTHTLHTHTTHTHTHTHTYTHAHTHLNKHTTHTPKQTHTHTHLIKHTYTLTYICTHKYAVCPRSQDTYIRMYSHVAPINIYNCVRFYFCPSPQVPLSSLICMHGRTCFGEYSVLVCMCASCTLC